LRFSYERSLFYVEGIGDQVLWVVTHVTHKVIRPSPLAPVPKKERETRKKLKMALAPLLPLWEKGLGG
jgi:hypothetical protein